MELHRVVAGCGGWSEVCEGWVCWLPHVESIYVRWEVGVRVVVESGLLAPVAEEEDYKCGDYDRRHYAADGDTNNRGRLDGRG